MKKYPEAISLRNEVAILLGHLSQSISQDLGTFEALSHIKPNEMGDRLVEKLLLIVDLFQLRVYKQL